MTPEEREQLLHDIERIEFPQGVPAGVDPEEVRHVLERIAEGSSTKPQSNSFYEWSIKRLERRVRILTVAVVVAVLALGVGLPLALLRDTGASSAGPLASTDNTNDAAMSGIRADLDRIQNKLDERDAAFAKLRNELTDTRRCAARGVHQLEQRVRQLVKGNVGPNEWVRAPAVSACAAKKR